MMWGPLGVPEAPGLAPAYVIPPMNQSCSVCEEPFFHKLDCPVYVEDTKRLIASWGLE